METNQPDTGSNLRFRYCEQCGRRGWTTQTICPHCLDFDHRLKIAEKPDDRPKEKQATLW